uniref:Glutathione transferase n=1 Tax=Onchocerca volvulus TaxID=6282 RepID=A0A8R1TZ73_ONCVO
MFGSLLICILCFSFADIATAISPNHFMSRFPQQGYPKSSSNCIRIYSLPFCPYCERVIIAAYKKRIQFDIININLRNKPDWFFAKNPEGTVPTVEHNGEVCDAIRKVSYSKKLTGNITKLLAMELAKAEQMLESPFYSGETLGLPDTVLYPCIQRLRMIGQTINDGFLDNYFPNHFSKLVKWFVRMQTLPEAMQETEQHSRTSTNSKGNHNACFPHRPICLTSNFPNI